MNKTHKEKVESFISEYSFDNNLKNNSLSTYGIWRINGEDPNCDFGGSHSNPYLETVEGTLENAIHYAVELPRFYTWGSGGEITRVIVKKIDDTSVVVRKEKEEKIKALEMEINKIRKNL